MAVALMFISVLVRIDAIRAKYPGGWDQFLKDAEGDIGERVIPPLSGGPRSRG
jgi:hypothetical protein